MTRALQDLEFSEYLLYLIFILYIVEQYMYKIFIFMHDDCLAHTTVLIDICVLAIEICIISEHFEWISRNITGKNH